MQSTLLKYFIAILIFLTILNKLVHSLKATIIITTCNHDDELLGGIIINFPVLGSL
jgi:hypothetical protein